MHTEISDQPEPEHAQPQPETATVQVPGSIPPRVMLAFQFVAHCNNQMGLRGFCVSDPLGQHHCKAVMQELHPTQEAAFRVACQAIGKFIAGT